MPQTLTLYLFEFTLLVSVFYFFLKFLSQDSPGVFWYIPLGLTCCALLPLLNIFPQDFSNTAQTAIGTVEILPMSVTYSGNPVLTVRDIFGLIYLCGFAYLLLKKTDRLQNFSAAKDPDLPYPSRMLSFGKAFYGEGNQSAKLAYRLDTFPILLTELLTLIFWFHPVVFLLHKKYKTLFAEKAPPLSRNTKAGRMFGRFFLLLVLLTGTSFTQKNILQPHLQGIDKKINAHADAVLYDWEKAQKGTVLDWGETELAVVNTRPRQNLLPRYEVRMMNRPFFNEIKDEDFRLYKDGEKQRIIHAEALISAPDFEKPLHAVGSTEITKYLNAVSAKREMTVLLKFQSENQEEWFAAFAVTRYAKLYLDHPGIQAFMGQAQIAAYKLDAEKPLYKNEEVILGNVKEEMIYEIKWGEMRVLLEKIANPNVWNGRLEIDYDDFAEMHGSSVSILKNGESQLLQNFQIDKFDPTDEVKYPRRFYNYADENFKEKYESVIPEKLLAEYNPGAGYYLRGETEDINFEAYIRIIDPYDPYRAEKYAAMHSNDPAEFTYQVINFPGKKTVLKTDTLQADNQAFVKMYDDRSRYEIIHVPNFQTNLRLLTADNFIWWEKETERKKRRPDFWRLPEYIDYIGQPTALLWGDLFANPNSPVLTRADVSDNARRALRLQIGEKRIFPQRFEMLVRRGEEEPEIFQIERDNREYLLPDLSEIETETSIYFQKITLESEGREMFLPVTFAFHIGKEQEEFTLKIEETGGGTESDTLRNERDNYYFAYKNYALQDIIADLAGYKRHYVRTFGEAKNPVLNVEYVSEKINTQNGIYRLILELRRKYRFSYQDKFETRSSYRLGLGSERKLDNFIVSAAAAKNASDDYMQEGETAILETATLSDLAQFIEKKFNVYIYVVAGKYDEAFYFSLDISSLAALTAQLETDYGLQLIHGNYPVRFLDVTFL